MVRWSDDPRNPAGSDQDVATTAEGCDSIIDSPETKTMEEGAGHESDPFHRSPHADRMGRYLIIEQVGSGAMGVVYAAYDPLLDRKVALKVVRSGVSRPGAAGDRHQMRMVREAKVLARLDHPNIVSIHDAGVCGNGVFLAMELSGGLTVKEWLQALHHEWQEILGVFLQAGRGLAAAHEAGVVHRDFKPSNVMIGDDGRARVLDFGVAVATSDHSEEPHSGSDEHPTKRGPRSRDMLRDRGNGLVGTPAYIAPEIHQGRQASPESDQFSFCAALYEALYGERPFAGQTLSEYQKQIVAGAVRPAPAGSKVPLWLRRVLLQGLQPIPAERHPSMAALLRQLEDNPSASRRRRLTRAAGAGIAVVAITLILLLIQLSRPRLESGECKLEGAWDEQLRQQVRRAFAAVHSFDAQVSLASVEQMLDTYSEDWLVQYSANCVAAGRLKGKLDGVLEQRFACLDDRLAELRAHTTALAEADEALVYRAVEATGDLSPIRDCADEHIMLMGRIDRPQDDLLAAEIRTLRDQLAEAKALFSIRRDTQGLDQLLSVIERSSQVGAPILEARGKLLLAEYYLLRSDHTEAELAEIRRLCYECIWIAEAERADVLVAQGRQRLVTTLRGSDSDEEVQRTIGSAVAAHKRVGESSGLWADLYNSLGSAERARGRYQEATEYYRRTVTLREQLDGADSILFASTLNDLAASLLTQGLHAEALPILTRSLDIKVRLLGSDHAGLSSTLGNIGLCHAAMGEYDLAAASYERARVIAEQLSDYRKLADIHNKLGSLEWRRQRYQDSLSHLQQSLEIQRQELGPRHVKTAITLNNIGELYATIGNHAQALEHFQLALAIEEERLGPEHPFLAFPLTGIGKAHLNRHEPQEARAFLERAVAIRRGSDGRPIDSADSLFALAQVLTETGEHDRARVLAQEALTAFQEAGPDGVEGAHAVEDLLQRLAEKP